MEKKDTFRLKPPSHRPRSGDRLKKGEQPTKSGTPLTGDKLIEVTHKLDQNPTILPPEDSEEFLRCVLYVRMHELTEAKTKKELAEEFFKINYKTMIAWIVSWQASGLLQRVRSMIFTALVADDIAAAADKVALEWAAIVRRQIHTAKHSASDKTSLEAAAWIHEVFIKPRMEQQEGDSNDELNYVLSIREGGYTPNPMGLLDTGDEDESGEALLEPFDFDIPETDMNEKPKIDSKRKKKEGSE